MTPADYDGAMRVAREARRGLEGLFGDVDVILTLSAASPAPAGYASTGNSRFNRLWTLLGVPCVTVPIPTAGPPLGVQVIANLGEDGSALAAARFIEAALG